MGTLFAFLSALSFAITNLLIKKGMEKQQTKENGYLITVIMNVLLLGLLAGVFHFLNDDPPAFTAPAFIYFVLSGLLTIGLGRYSFFASISHIGPSRASAIKNASPIFTILFALLVLQESLSWQSAGGIALIMAGVLSISWRAFAQPGESLSLKNVGYLLGIASALFFGIGQAIRKAGLEQMDDAFFGAWVGAVTSLILLVVYESGKGTIKATLRENRKLLKNPYFITAGALNSFGPLFFFLGATYAPVSIVSAVAAVEPLLTVLLSRLFFHMMEQLPLAVWSAAVLVFSGTCLMILL